ncbi:hypothetical protein Hypma_003479 [Hypsizygus marmoreus]|uniref:RING-type domain-containing protein n=1 Tax=Hypsizygus marmoreus TaxID=39966 RepID=A0A369J238_HYPMA|nr:hypothetical protein Hypma_003479 [Hypsizygus marmoreus]
MGQNSSRTQRHNALAGLSSNSITSADGATPDTSFPSSSSSEPTLLNVAPQAGPSRSSSVRRSILNLVKPSVRGRADSSASSSRKSWRHSKPWSKAPELTETPESSQSAGSSTIPASLIKEKGKGVDRSPDPLPVEAPIDADEYSPTPLPLPSPEDVSEISEGSTGANHEASQSTLDSLAAETIPPTLAPDGSDDQDEVVIQPDVPPDDATSWLPEAAAPPQDAPEPLPESPSVQQPTPTHQFPPPGTLVVVQGVVHTTDVPRPPAPTTSPPGPAAPPLRSSSTPPHPSGGSTRNRLSALLQSRPASIIGSRPPSTIGTISSNNHTSTTLDASPTPDNPSPDASNPTNPASPPEPANPSTPNPSTQAPPTNSRPGTISSSSIDVLGTLLSVAAAATAASLLAGTEPLLASGLGPTATPPTHPNAASPTTDPWISRPTSPTPTTGLRSGPDTIDPTAAGRTERLRQAWGNIRERLGLRPAPHPAAVSSLDPTPESDGPVGSLSNDPRELVLAQMARAFNLGFGLASENTGQRSGESEGREHRTDEAAGTGGVGSAGPAPLPLEGSFEQFLADLQTDLRVALTSPNALPADATAIAHAPSSTESTSDASPADDSSHRGYAARNGNEDEQDQDDDLRNSGDISDSESESEDVLEQGDEAATATYSSDLSSSRGPEPRPSSSTSQATDATHVPPISSDPRPSNESSGLDIDGTPDNDAPERINWWRLYRFPPITTPRPPGAAPITSTTSSSSLDSPTQSTDTALEVDPTLSELPFANDMEEQQLPPPPRNHTVVPVIVVGVQSVNASWQPPTGTDVVPNDPDNMRDIEDAGEPEANADLAASEGNNTDRPDTNGRQSAPRGRAWHSRAAEALRNLRPGRRPRATPAANSPGSRTFLIYVIGGYYPPDHTIVTGGPNSLDSFEALLELAELLGQVKPPTVTKEDIERSGLEIIKSSQLEQYEKAQKISSNCTERCLICLDDYAPEDNIRVMTCRHAFHKICVDKWLETGRNNCPACRSKGVSSDAQ